MTAATTLDMGHGGKRARMLLTPEGLALPLRVASRGARAGALMLDILIVVLGLILFVSVLAYIGFGMLGVEDIPPGPAEALAIVAILFLFFMRYGYFMIFELGPRGATPGKRLLGIRVAARDGGQLTAEMVIARNLIRDIELTLPAGYLLSVMAGGSAFMGISDWATFAWLLIFMLFPFLNRDALRAGDVVAGTWVVEASRARLKAAMSLAPDHRTTYRFGPAELSVYGEHELQVLESVLRQNQPEALRDVAEAITRKIGWQAGAGDEREFLEAFYAALRGHLEGRMRFGKRKKDKYS